MKRKSPVDEDFNVEFGRVEGGLQYKTYPMSRWNSIYKSKIKKGYVDISPKPSDIVTVKKSNGKSHPFFDKMMSYRNDRVTTTYSVNANQVTDSQKNEAQSILTELTRSKIKTQNQQQKTNKLLIDLYTVIPRKMKDTRDHLFPNINDLGKLVEFEQDNLDSISSSVIESNDLDIDIDDFKTLKPIKYLMDQLNSVKLNTYQLNCERENKKFNNWMSSQDDKSIKYLIHGTRCSSVIPILETGLQIRPSGNFHYAGKVYGDGNYFSEVVNKSLNYTGHDEDKILLIYEVHTGNPFIYEGWYRTGKTDQELSYTALKKNGYDSTYVKAGDGLLNSEIIAYKEEQSRLAGVIHLENHGRFR